MSDSNEYLQHLKRDNDVAAAADDFVFVVALASVVAIVFALCSWLAWRTFVQPCKNDPNALLPAAKRD
jgi:hypothetical protein